MTYTISTMHKNALTALTALTTRMRKSSAKEAGMDIGDRCHSFSAPVFAQEERLAANHRFHVLRNQAADMLALMDECISESLDRSDWVVPKHRELRRYELLDASQMRHHPWLDYCDFAELYAATQVVEMSCHQAPRDLILLNRYLTLSEMVFDCLFPTRVQTESRKILQCGRVLVGYCAAWQLRRDVRGTNERNT